MEPSLCEVSASIPICAAGSLARVAVPLRAGPTGGTLRPVEDTDRDELRRLALWLSRRRAVDEAVGVLTAYGPAASDRIHSHLDALRLLLDAEQDAFDAIRAHAPRVAQLPLPDLVDGHVRLEGRTDATVHSIGAARERHLT
jgi:hypothetical protein